MCRVAAHVSEMSVESNYRPAATAWGLAIGCTSTVVLCSTSRLTVEEAGRAILEGGCCLYSG
jgi:hypothetical protein